MTQTTEFQTFELIIQCVPERVILGMGSSVFSSCYQFLSNQSAISSQTRLGVHGPLAEADFPFLRHLPYSPC